MTGPDDRPEEIVGALPIDGVGSRGDGAVVIRQALAVANDPAIVIRPEVLQRFGARVLDPSTAARTAGQRPFRSTVYLGDKLLVTDPAARDALVEAARSVGLQPVDDRERAERQRRLLTIAREAGVENAERLFPELLTFGPIQGTAATPDAWLVLQTFRATAGADPALGAHVALDHLLTATMHVVPGPFDKSGSGSSEVLSSYGDPGWGGRQPVNWLGAAPPRQADVPFRRPVVAVLDTGVGQHDWFDSPGTSCVHRNAELFGLRIGLAEPSGSEVSGVVTDPLEGALDPYSGHGTFIAGLVRQQCPDADILSARVMPSAGALAEHTLLETLSLLVCRQAIAQAEGIAADVIDVVSLSLGYYHEQPEDELFDPLLLAPIQELGRRGVAVVASAGNDATTRPMFPAAFTVYPLSWTPAQRQDCVPVASVGALNPDGSAALFSNEGPWVTCDEPGAALVSTFPRFDAGRQASVSFEQHGERRATIDPDDFTAGFGVWSGTSFAAPVLAGKIAQSLVLGGSTDDLDPSVGVQRTSAAVAEAIARSPQ